MHSTALSLAPGSRRAKCDPFWLHQSGLHFQNSSRFACLCSPVQLSAWLLILQISKACHFSMAPVCQKACYIKNASCFLSPYCPSWDTMEKKPDSSNFFQGQRSLLLTVRKAFQFSETNPRDFVGETSLPRKESRRIRAAGDGALPWWRIGLTCLEL